MITAKSYFSGAGGMDLGILEAGINIIESFEIDKHCCETLKNNFSHKINESDITKITVLDQQDADVYIGTFPCTRYSTAADINGTRTGDDLFLHFFRHIALAKPEMYVVENVPGMLKFKVVMEALTKLPDYYVRIEYPDCNRIHLKDIVEHNVDMNIPQYVLNRINGKYRDKPIVSDPELDDLAPTCVAHYSKDRGTRLIKDGKNVRPYTVLEYARLQGFPDWFKFSGSNSDSYKQIGNAVPVPMGYWVGKQIVRYFECC